MKPEYASQGQRRECGERLRPYALQLAPGVHRLMLTRIALALMWLLRLLPLRLLAAIGAGFGTLLYAFGRERRRICLINLARCLPELSAGERDALARRHFQAFARTFLERAILWWGSPARIRRLVRIEGMEHFQAVRGGPLILLAPHFVGLDMGGGAPDAWNSTWCRFTPGRKTKSSTRCSMPGACALAG